MMTRSTKRTSTAKKAQPRRAAATKKPAVKKAAASKTTARKKPASKPKKESFFHKILTAEGWRRLMSGRKAKATARKK